MKRSATHPHGAPALRGVAEPDRWLLAVAIAGSALAVGTVHTLTLCIVTAVLAAAVLLGWWGAAPMSMRPSATLLLITGACLTVYTALQCVPVPIRWLAFVAPHNADVWSRALAPLREAGPGWASVTLDPTATRVEALKGVAYLCAFAAAVRIARQREGARFLSGAVVVTGLALGIAALLHPAFGAHKLFGVYEPTQGISERHIAPMMNPNNLAGYLNVAICLALAAALAPEPVAPRPIAAAVVLVLGATQIWVASRGGVVAMALGVSLVLAIARLGRSRERGAVARLSLVAGAVSAAGVVMVVLFGSDDASNELLVGDTSKLTTIARATRMLPAMPLFGCGRGAFESVYPAFRTDVGHLTYSFPENVLVQWVVEWGLPIGVASFAAISFALRPSAVLARSATASGAWAAVCSVTVQNFADLGSEIPGLALACVVCAAIVVAGTPGHRPRWRLESWSKAPRLLAVAMLACAVLSVGVAAAGVGRELHADQRLLHSAGFQQPVSRDAMRDLARTSMLRHPAEPYLPFMAAFRAYHARDENPIPWIGATLERAGVYGPAHLLLARVVAPRSPSQARLEYRLAMEQTPDLVPSVMAEAPRFVGSYDDVMELVPGGKAGILALEMVWPAVVARLPSTAARVDAELTARVPMDRDAALHLARDAVEDVELPTTAPWCSGPEAREACVRKAFDGVAHAQQATPHECEPYALRARLRVAKGEASAALTELQGAADAVTDRVTCLQSLETAARAVGEARIAESALEAIVATGCADDSECAGHLQWVAGREEATGNPRKALVLYKKAYERMPDDDTLLEAAARLAALTGLHNQAAEDYERLARKRPQEPRWRAAQEVERAAAIKSAVNQPEVR